MKKNLLIIIWIFFFGLVKSRAQENNLDYKNYIEQVQKNNILYAAERFNLDISETEVLSAKAFVDPELQLNYFDNGEAKRKMGFGYAGEIGWVVELGNKRKARVNVAKSELELSKLILIDYFKKLRTDATISFIQTLFQKELLDIKKNSYEMMVQLAKSDEIKFRLGEISETDARQTKLEAQSLKNEILQAESELETSQLKLSLFMGKEQTDFITEGNLTVFNRDFDLSELLNEALMNRTDLMIALQNKNVSQKNIELAKANRIIDLGVSLGIEHSSVVRNIIAETPQFTQIKGGITVPLKFSNKYNNELNVAKLQLKQNDLIQKQTELEIKLQVNEAFILYESSKKQLELFDLEMKKTANLILEAKTYSYNRGNSSLLELLDAQRTNNEIQSQYLKTKYNNIVSLINLEQAVGIWDIYF